MQLSNLGYERGTFSIKKIMLGTQPSGCGNGIYQWLACVEKLANGSARF